MKFSERIGGVRRGLQTDGVDEPLKNSIWNVVYRHFWQRYARANNELVSKVPAGRLLLALWTDHFNQIADDAMFMLDGLLKQVRTRYLGGDWLDIYGFAEFVVAYSDSHELVADLNSVLEKHVSAYRFVGTTLAPITNDEEIAAVEHAMGQCEKFEAVGVHIETALARLADRPTPDCRNSIKESISAVEAACQVVAGDEKATLGHALKYIGIHAALEKGLAAIYGYTSNADGIRHAILDEPTVDADDARFFLVSCSVFANYLIAKSV